MIIEQALLGSLMLDNERVFDIQKNVYPEMFTNASNKRVYEIILESAEKDEPFDVVSLSDKLGDDWLAPLGEMASLSMKYGRHECASKIIENHKSRNLIQKLGEANNKLISKTPVVDVVDELGLYLTSIEQEQEREITAIGSSMDKFVDDLEERYQRGGEVVGLTTGLADLDKTIQGMQDGNLIVIAGRPAMGKSVLAQNISTHNALKGKQVLFFSLEMTKHEIQQRVISSVSRTDYGQLQSAKCVDNGDDMILIADAIGKVKKMTLGIDDSSALSIQELKSKSISYARKNKGVDLIIVDYMQLLTAKAESRLQEVSLISRELKSLAKRLKCPVIALSQLNRGLESRSNKRPLVSDLRESGQIEQDADKILFIYRDEVYNENTRAKGLAEIILGKARNCERSDVVAVFDGATQTFKNAEHQAYEIIQETKMSGGKNEFSKMYA